MVRLTGGFQGLAARFSSGRTALFLYVVLVVLPAVVFGGLLWRQLGQDQDRLLEALPVECEDAADRLGVACASRVAELLYTEDERNFEVYRPEYFVDDRGPIRTAKSPLASEPRRPGVLGWFSFRPSAADSLEEPEITVLRGDDGGDDDPWSGLIQATVRAELADALLDRARVAEMELRAVEEREDWGETRERDLRHVVLNVADGPIEECRTTLEEEPTLLERRMHEVHVGFFTLSVIPNGPHRPPIVIATRNIVTPGLSDPTRRALPACIEAINQTVLLTQGFVLDETWLFHDMPKEEAKKVLGPSQRLIQAGEDSPDHPDVSVRAADLFGPLALLMAPGRATAPDARLRVSTDARQRKSDFREQNAWFAAMALILTISMAIGIRLLLISVRTSRVEAERTRNFVASVTHELRTPIAAVKLYGEMLSDGWIQDETRRQEYLQRIVHESDRLDGLVDRVLLRRRLSDQVHTPFAGDINAEILAQRHDLEMVGGRTIGDVTFDLGDDLPPVLMLRDGIHVIVQNLVENARKYAPVEQGPHGPTGEPILVRTRAGGKKRVLLEVLDRGPGIPEEDRDRIFDAFLRLGDERTRSTKGTGLGLHLVALQARAMKATVRAAAREGGGTVFRVALQIA